MARQRDCLNQQGWHLHRLRQYSPHQCLPNPYSLKQQNRRPLGSVQLGRSNNLKRLPSYDGGEVWLETALPNRRDSASDPLGKVRIAWSLGSVRVVLVATGVCSPGLQASVSLSPSLRAVAGLQFASRIRGRRVASIPNSHSKPRGLWPESSFNPKHDETV